MFDVQYKAMNMS